MTAPPLASVGLSVTGTMADGDPDGFPTAIIFDKATPEPGMDVCDAGAGMGAAGCADGFSKSSGAAETAPKPEIDSC